MDKEEIKKWLASTGKDRDWLAEQIGCTVGTLNQWFSKGFPDWGLKAVSRLITSPADPDAGLEVTFTASQWKLIEQARVLTGHKTHKDFYQDAILEYTQHIITREEALGMEDDGLIIIDSPQEEEPQPTPSKITHLREHIAPDRKVAEDPKSYGKRNS